MSGPVAPDLQRLRFAPALAATVATVLVLWLLFRAADIFLLLFVAILFSLYLGAATDGIVRRSALPRSAAFALAFGLTVAGIVGLFTLLVPPVVEQTQQLISNLPGYAASCVWPSAIPPCAKCGPLNPAISSGRSWRRPRAPSAAFCLAWSDSATPSSTSCRCW
jgi:hypothetical protein